MLALVLACAFCVDGATLRPETFDPVAAVREGATVEQVRAMAVGSWQIRKVYGIGEDPLTPLPVEGADVVVMSYEAPDESDAKPPLFVLCRGELLYAAMPVSEEVAEAIIASEGGGPGLPDRPDSADLGVAWLSFDDRDVAMTVHFDEAGARERIEVSYPDPLMLTMWFHRACEERGGG